MGLEALGAQGVEEFSTESSMDSSLPQHGINRRIWASFSEIKSHIVVVGVGV